MRLLELFQVTEAPHGFEYTDDQDDFARKRLRKQTLSPGFKKNLRPWFEHGAYTFMSDGPPLRKEWPTSFFVYDEEDRVMGQGTLMTMPNSYVRTAFIWVDPAYRKQGIGQALYNHVLDSGYKIVSDGELSQHAQKMWKELGNQHGLTYGHAKGEKPVQSDDDFGAVMNDPSLRFFLGESVNEIKGYEFGDEESNAEGTVDLYKGHGKKLKPFGRLPSGIRMVYVPSLTSVKHQGNKDIFFVPKGKRSTVGMATVAFPEKGVVMVEYIMIAPEAQGMGLGLEFYEYWLNQGYRILSDEEQTHKAEGLWRKLVSMYDAVVLRRANQQIERTPLTSYTEFESLYDGSYLTSLELLPSKRSTPLTEARKPSMVVKDVFHTTHTREKFDKLSVRDNMLFFSKQPRTMEFGNRIFTGDIWFNEPFMFTDTDIYNVESTLGTDMAKQLVMDWVHASSWEQIENDPELIEGYDLFDFITENIKGDDGFWQHPIVIAAMKKAGYDGVISNDHFGGSEEYAIFSDKQFIPKDQYMNEGVLDVLPPGARKLATGLALMTAINSAHGHESDLEHPSKHPVINPAAVYADRLNSVADIIGAENPDRYGQWVSNLYDVYQEDPEGFKRMFGVEYEKFMTAARMMTPKEMARFMKDVAQSYGGGAIKEDAAFTEGPEDFDAMKLSGNKLQDSINYFYNEHAPSKAKPKSLGKVDGFDIIDFAASDIHFLFLVTSEGRPVLYVAVQEFEDGIAIGNVRSTGEFPATKFYYYILNNISKKLYSDKAQTPQGRNIWKNLVKYFPDVRVTDVGNRLMAELPNMAQSSNESSDYRCINSVSDGKRGIKSLHESSSQLLYEAKCGIYNTLKKFRPDLAGAMEQVPGNSMNDSILFLQDNGLWDDTAHALATTIKQARRQLNTTFPPQGKEANAARHEKYREQWNKALNKLMCHVVGLIQASAQ